MQIKEEVPEKRFALWHLIDIYFGNVPQLPKKQRSCRKLPRYRQRLTV